MLNSTSSIANPRSSIAINTNQTNNNISIYMEEDRALHFLGLILWNGLISKKTEISRKKGLIEMKKYIDLLYKTPENALANIMKACCPAVNLYFRFLRWIYHEKKRPELIYKWTPFVYFPGKTLSNEHLTQVQNSSQVIIK